MLQRSHLKILFFTTFDVFLVFHISGFLRFSTPKSPATALSFENSESTLYFVLMCPAVVISSVREQQLFFYTFYVVLSFFIFSVFFLTQNHMLQVFRSKMLKLPTKTHHVGIFDVKNHRVQTLQMTETFFDIL